MAHLIRSTLLGLVAAAAVAGMTGPAQAGDTTPDAQLAYWQSQAGVASNADRGRQFFTSKHGAEWSCASCHGVQPTGKGSHASTGKVIDPMAPAFNPGRFTLTAKVDRWFRRNCKDVLGRECAAGEKADVLAYLMSLK